jgi:RNA polymerase sigma-70 factor (sigma-E family)
MINLVLSRRSDSPYSVATLVRQPVRQPVGQVVGPSAEQPTSSGQFLNAETAYRLHRHSLVRFARALVADPNRAEDLVHDAFVRAYSRHETLEDAAAYLRATIINLARDGARRDALFRKRAPGLVPPVISKSKQSEDRLDLLGSIYRLPVRQRAAIVLRFYEDRTEADIARILNCRPGTVKSLLSRALATLRTEARS